MQKLLLPHTEYSPEIDFNHETHNLKISGYSRAENVRKFFMPVLDWLEAYRNEILEKNSKEVFEKNPICIIFKMDYFNSPTNKFLFDIIKKVVRYNNEGYNIIVEWYYEKDDEFMQATGEEFSDMIEFPFNFIET